MNIAKKQEDGSSSARSVENILEKIGDGSDTDSISRTLQVGGDDTKEGEDGSSIQPVKDNPPSAEEQKEQRRSSSAESMLEMNVLPPSSAFANDTESLKGLDVEIIAKRMNKLAGEVEYLKADASRRNSEAVAKKLSDALKASRDDMSRPARDEMAKELQEENTRSSIATQPSGTQSMAAAMSFQLEMEAAIETLRNDLFREFGQFRADVGSKFSEVTFTVEQTNMRIGTAASMKDLKLLEAVIDDKMKASESQTQKRQMEATHELDAKLYEDLGKIAAWKQKLEENMMERVRNLEKNASDTANMITSLKNDTDLRMKSHSDDMEATREWVKSKLNDINYELKEDGKRIHQMAGSIKNFELDIAETENTVRECFKEVRNSEAAMETRSKEMMEEIGKVREELGETNQQLRKTQTEFAIMDPRVSELETTMDDNKEEMSKARMKLDAHDKRFIKVDNEIKRVIDVEVGYCRTKLKETAAAIAEERSKSKHQFDVHEKDIKALGDELKNILDNFNKHKEEMQREHADLKAAIDSNKKKCDTWDFMRPKVELALENLSQVMRRVHKLEDQRKDYANLFAEIRDHVDEFHARLPEFDLQNKMVTERLEQMQNAMQILDQKASKGENQGGSAQTFISNTQERLKEMHERLDMLEENHANFHEDISMLKERPVQDLAPMTIKVSNEAANWSSDEARKKSMSESSDDETMKNRKRMNSQEMMLKMQQEIQEFGRRVSRAPFLHDRAYMLGNMCVQYEESTRKKSFCPPLSDEWRALMARTVHDVANFIATTVDINVIASSMIPNPEMTYLDDEIGKKRSDACGHFMQLISERVLMDHPEAGVLKLEARNTFFKRVSEGLDMALSKFEKILLIGQSRISATVPKCIACDRPLLNSQHRINKEMQDGLEQPSLVSDISPMKSGLSSSWGSRNLGNMRPPSSKKRRPKTGKKKIAGSESMKDLRIGNEGNISSRDWITPRPTTAPGGQPGGYVMRGGFRMPKNQLQLTSPEFVAELVEEQSSLALSEQHQEVYTPQNRISSSNTIQQQEKSSANKKTHHFPRLESSERISGWDTSNKGNANH